jgi:deoxycytidylate deaminase
MKIPPLSEHLKKHPKDIRKATMIAFIIRRGKVIAVGYNRKKFASVNRLSYHAEEQVLKKAGSRAFGASILIVRIRKNGMFGNAKPCEKCDMLIRRYRIPDSNVQWSKTEWVK